MSDVRTGFCLDCGKLATGIRCQKDHGAYLRRLSLEETAVADRELLAMLAVEKLSYERIGIRFGVSRTRAHQKVANARRREQARSVLAFELKAG